MTENEAKTKWCPHRANEERLNHIGSALANITVNGAEIKGKSQACIGSDCMMWVPDSESFSVYPATQKTSVVVGGHCGLAK